MRPIRSIATALLAASLALLTGSAMAQPALPAAASTSSPSPERWLSVSLGSHTFGHLRTPDAIVATAGPKQVGFERPQEGPNWGPWSFDVTRDRSIWLLDQFNHRLLAWQPGHPTAPVRTIKVPDPPLIADFAVADDGSIYVSYADRNQRVPGMDYNMSLAALSPSGQVRWKGPTIIAVFNGQLRFGPDGALYWPGFDGTWTQLTTKDGRLLTIAEQRQRTRLGQPLSGGRRLLSTWISDHEFRVVLLNQAGRAVRGWRITSKNDLGGLRATPALVGGDPVIVLGISQQTKAKFLYEYLVLRLAPNGGTRVRFALDPHATWGDVPITGVRVGPDGQLYQLRTNPAWGVRIARFSLQPPKPTPPTTSTPAGGVVPPSTVTPPPATSALAPTVTAPTTPPVQQPTSPSVQPTTPSVQARPLWRSLAPWLAALMTVALAAAAEVWLWRRRRHRRHPAGPRRPHPAH